MNPAKVLSEHRDWLNGTGGKRANLYEANLRGANLRGANLCEANLYGADLREANLYGADLREADLREADLYGADLREANLCGADLREADLRGADLYEADLRGADLLDPMKYMNDTFEHDRRGYIVYKTFGHLHTPPSEWVIEAGSIITDNANADRTLDCACGINVATLEWVKAHNDKCLPIWKLRIPWKAAVTIVVPYNTDGKIRCEYAEIIGEVAVSCGEEEPTDGEGE